MSDMDEIEKFANETLGGLPEVIKLLGNHNVEMAKEQFRENNSMYLGRINLPKKILALTALSVSLANGQNSSAMIHFKLATKFGAKFPEILDSIKTAKMVLMASTMDVMKDIEPVIAANTKNMAKNGEVKKILENIKSQSGMDDLPENLVSLSNVSFDLFQEHLKEKTELLSPLMVDMKYVYLMAFADSVSIRYKECAKTYLKQFFKLNGTYPEMEDALFLTRFVTGNKAMTSSISILK